MNARGDVRALAICGPTAVGKSEIAALVAKSLGGEIVNADSRQIYDGMRVGTGWPLDAVMRRIPHHLYGVVDPCVRYSAGEFVVAATAEIRAIAARRRVPIVVGGTGLYIEALGGTMPLNRPVADDSVRERVRSEARAHSHEFLREWLESIAPDAARRTKPGDRYRTLRALEAHFASSSTGALPRDRSAGGVALDVVLLSLDRLTLEARVRSRVDAMFDGGLFEEAVALWRRCADAPALTGIGFAEALALQRGEATRAEAIRATISRTIRYAKRQQTWFRRMHSARVVDALDAAAAATAIVAFARETAAAT